MDKRAVVLEPEEKKVNFFFFFQSIIFTIKNKTLIFSLFNQMYHLMQQISTIKNQKLDKKRAKQKEDRIKFLQKKEKEDALSKERKRKDTKRFFQDRAKKKMKTD